MRKYCIFHSPALSRLCYFTVCRDRRMMSVFVKMASNNRTVTVDVQPDELIDSLKTMIEAKTTLPVSQQKLKTLTGKTLDNGRTLRDYNIQQNSTLHCSFTWLRTEEEN